jgi:pilus assembly protein Flp/PilA
VTFSGHWLRRQHDHVAVTGSTTQERSREAGASAVEYGLLIAGIAAIIAVAIFAFGGGSGGLFNNSCKTIFTDRSVGSCSS